jgi:hypothetical protein
LLRLSSKCKRVGGPPGDRDQPSRCHPSLPFEGRLGGQATSGLNNLRVLRVAMVGPLQHRIRQGGLVGLQYGKCPLTEQLGSAHAATSGNAVQPLNKFIIELNEDLFSSHAHMLTHMLRTGRTHAHERRRRIVLLTELYSNPFRLIDGICVCMGL